MWMEDEKFVNKFIDWTVDTTWRYSLYRETYDNLAHYNWKRSKQQSFVGRSNVIGGRPSEVEKFHYWDLKEEKGHSKEFLTPIFIVVTVCHHDMAGRQTDSNGTRMFSSRVNTNCLAILNVHFCTVYTI